MPSVNASEPPRSEPRGLDERLKTLEAWRASGGNTQQAPARTQRLRGRVIDQAKRAVPFARVQAFISPAELHDAEVSCGCTEGCAQTLLTCGCTHAALRLTGLLSYPTSETEDDLLPIVVSEGVANEEGHFELAVPEGMAVGLSAAFEGREGIDAERPTTVGERVVIIDATEALRGRVFDENGAVVPGARVTVLLPRAGRTFTLRADAEGRFERAGLPTGPVLLVARAEGFVPIAEEVVLSPDPSPPHPLVLSPPRTITGMVERDGVGVADVEVTLESDHLLQRTRTDKAGRFLFGGLAQGGFGLQARSEGLVARTDVTLHGPLEESVVLSLGVPAVIEGTVRDERGEPLAGAHVALVPMNRGWWDDEPSLQLLTAADGTWRAELGMTGPVRVLAGKEGYLGVDEQVDVERGERTRAELQLHLGAAIRALVVDEAGSPVPNAYVNVIADVETIEAEAGPEGFHGHVPSASARSGEDGTVELVGLFPKTAYLASISAEGFVSLDHQKVRAGAEGERWQLSRGASIRGRVLDAEGHPVAGALLLAGLDPADPQPRRRGEASTAGRSGADGRFHLSGLREGLHNLHAERPVSDDSVHPGPSVSAKVQVLAAGTKEVVLRFGAGHRLTGRVVDEGGRAAPGFDVVLVRDPLPEEGFETGMHVSTDPAGLFTFENLPAGDFELNASRGSFESSERLRLRAPQQAPITLVPRRAGRIVGRVVDEGGRPLTLFSVAGTVFRDADGRFELELADDGPRTLELLVPEHKGRSIEVNVTRDQVSDVGVVRLERTSRLSPRAEDEP